LDGERRESHLAKCRCRLGVSYIPYEILEAESTRLPEPGGVGVILNQENLGFAGRNNVGFRLLCSTGVPVTWVLNNDTLLQSGSSDALIRAAEARPEVGL
jgi:GT2 family glycosyltransferase